MPERYTLRKRGTDKKKDVSSSSPRQQRSPGFSDRSGYSTSPHSRGRDSSYEDDEQNSEEDSQAEEEDYVDLSYPSTTASPTAETPSPHSKRKNYKIQASHYQTPPSRLYPSLSDVSDRGSPGVEQEKKDSPGAPRRRRQPAKDDTSANIALYVTVVVVLMIVLFWLSGAFSGSSSATTTKMPSFKAYTSEIDKLETEFTSQDRRTWRSLKSSVKHILNNTESEYPAVVLFAVNSEYGAVASCLARRVASVFNSVRDIPGEDGYFDAATLKHLQSQQQKKVLDDKINVNFQIGYSVVIDHLESLYPSASLLLHGICDNDNAPLKDVFIAIVFYVNRDVEVGDIDSELHKYFEAELDVDKIGALLTRINNNAVVINREKIEKLPCQ